MNTSRSGESTDLVDFIVVTPSTRAAAARLHVPFQDKRSALTWLWAEIGAHTLHVDVATVKLDELPTSRARAGNVAAREVRGAALAAQRK